VDLARIKTASGKIEKATCSRSWRAGKRRRAMVRRWCDLSRPHEGAADRGGARGGSERAARSGPGARC